MTEENPILTKMGNLLSSWEAANDRRLIFLQCYRMMTQNIQAAIDAKEFIDNAWVNNLMENFAGYYFRALDAYESERPESPIPWQIAFKSSQSSKVHVMQNLVLGVNAHINYDLVFALSDLLSPEWESLSPEQRKMRYHDHCHVNEVIHQTINAVQDQVVDRYEPIFGVVDFLLGPIDEWMTTLLISQWREEVWEHATQYIETTENDARSAIMEHVKETAVRRAKDILGHGGLVDLESFI